MYMFLLVFHIFISIMLIVSVLIQTGKGSSLSNIFGGGGMETVFGAETSAVLNKMTSVIAILFIISSIVLATTPGRLATRSILHDEIRRQEVSPPPAEPPPGPGELED